jgi:hypothetical protein
MKKILDLVAPELGLVFDLAFAGEILYDEDRLVGDLGFFDAKFKIFFFGGMTPMKADELFEFALHHLCAVGGTIPGEAEYIIPFVNFICEPLLQSGGSA